MHTFIFWQCCSGRSWERVPAVTSSTPCGRHLASKCDACYLLSWWANAHNASAAAADVRRCRRDLSQVCVVIGRSCQAETACCCYRITLEAQLPLREQGVSLVHSSHHNATSGHLAFKVYLCMYVTCGISSENIWQRTRASLQK